MFKKNYKKKTIPRPRDNYRGKGTKAYLNEKKKKKTGKCALKKHTASLQFWAFIGLWLW